jgi:peptidoglycan/xylan/chitin deacetylase (PgdA/CDA1 family)
LLTRATEFLERNSSRLAFTRWLPARNKRGVVSFTFDDIPETAAGAGAKILEASGVQGTFYVAGGLISGEAGGGYATTDDLRRLAAYGHELGCHTYSHVKASTLGAARLAEECDRNQAFVREALGDVRLTSFGYPFGAVSPPSKFRLQSRFASCRGTGAGLNAGLVDLGLLRAERLYAGRTSEARVRSLIDAARYRSAWLIFYTHDVSPSPSEWGATPDQLRRAVEMAQEASLEILPVRAALARLAYGEASHA